MAEQKKVYIKEAESVPVVPDVPEVGEIVEEKVPAPRALTASEREIEAWRPKSETGRKVKSGEITDINQILEKGVKIREAQIVDKLLPGMAVNYITVGQAHGKFGGGKRRIIKQTQKKTAEGNKPVFTAMAVVGDERGHVGVGMGRAKESIPAKEKSLRQAKLNLMRVAMGCGSWKCGCGTKHSLPFEVRGKSGSVEVALKPAPKGTGLAVDDELKKILRAAGYKDIWSKTWGQTRKKINFIHATMNALRKASQMKVTR